MTNLKMFKLQKDIQLIISSLVLEPESLLGFHLLPLKILMFWTPIPKDVISDAQYQKASRVIGFCFSSKHHCTTSCFKTKIRNNNSITLFFFSNNRAHESNSTFTMLLLLLLSCFSCV